MGKSKNDKLLENIVVRLRDSDGNVIQFKDATGNIVNETLTDSNGKYTKDKAIEILGENILEEKGQELGIKIIDTINAENDKYAKQYNRRILF